MANNIRQCIPITTNNFSIKQNQNLYIKFPTIKDNEIIIPNTPKLTFDLKINSTDNDATLFQNIGRTIVKKITIRMDGKEIMSIDNNDIYHCYTDLWKSTTERLNMVYQGIGTSNMLKHRINSSDAVSNIYDEVLANTYGSRFCIPLDIKNFYHKDIMDKIEYEFIFNENSKVIKSKDLLASYEIKNINLEFDIFTDFKIPNQIIYYDNIYKQSLLIKNKSDILWNMDDEIYSKDIKGILILFKDPENPDNEIYYNPKITNIKIKINDEETKEIKPYHYWDEINKFLNLNINISDTTVEKYLTNHYGLWLDCRLRDEFSSNKNNISIQLTKTSEENKPIHLYLFYITSEQLNI